MRIYVESVLECAPEKVWERVQTSALLLEVIRPLVRIAAVPPHGLPERWASGSTIRCRSYVLGFIPIGERTLHFESIDQAKRAIQTQESDSLFRRWDHLVSVRDAGDGRTLYSDEIEVDAGILTPLAFLVVQAFYRHRQRRWRRVARRLAALSP